MVSLSDRGTEVFPCVIFNTLTAKKGLNKDIYIMQIPQEHFCVLHGNSLVGWLFQVTEK